ncbi:MAG: AbiV family abortive infection protein [Candidatus Bathyarchaeota archaeon]|nr:AbiV family abortive infection protein [Candidatus Bathyarchaeota archaeon]
MNKSRTKTEIPLEKAEFGITLILDNVLEFVRETRILLGKSRTTHSRGLLELAIQELGKAKLLKRRFLEQTRLMMDDVKKRKKLTPRNIQIEEFFDPAKKHENGTSMLREDAREIADQILPRFLMKGSLRRNLKTSGELEQKVFSVNWENGEWSLPSPTKVFEGFNPPKKLLIQLGILTDAIEDAAKRLISE